MVLVFKAWNFNILGPPFRHAKVGRVGCRSRNWQRQEVELISADGALVRDDRRDMNDCMYEDDRISVGGTEKREACDGTNDKQPHIKQAAYIATLS